MPKKRKSPPSQPTRSPRASAKSKTGKVARARGKAETKKEARATGARKAQRKARPSAKAASKHQLDVVARDEDIESASRLRTKQSFTRELLEELLFGSGRVRRFTQDSPVLPDVWLDYAGVAGDLDEWSASEGETLQGKKLLITPYKEKGAGAVRREIVRRLSANNVEGLRVAYNQTTVSAILRFQDLVKVVLPMTEWWAQIERDLPVGALQYGPFSDELAAAVQDPEHAPPIEFSTPRPAKSKGGKAETAVEEQACLYRYPPALLWTIRVIGALHIVHSGQLLPEGFCGPKGVAGAALGDWRKIVEAFQSLIPELHVGPDEARIYSVSRNRLATPAVIRSTLAIKADAGRRLFNISCAGLAWAIIDSGIDAKHPAFRTRTGLDGPADPDPFKSRVLRTYDFTQIDKWLDPKRHEEAKAERRLQQPADAEPLEDDEEQQARLNDLRDALESGRPLDWQVLEPLLRVPHQENKYVPPPADHGTHVAGILAGNWKASESRGALQQDLMGTCPDISLYDLRVFDASGRGEEFGIMAALQFVRWLNSSNDYMVVHGANLSLSIRHEIANYACGRTPVCDECERLVSSGVVVVAAAGNQGHRRYATERGMSTEAYNSISITDPGNAEEVITVGATHRYRPHTYGVSYFSSRGPTGDGRRKPDIVAPGEKILSTLPQGGLGSKDGTSMAAPHVSGAAALLLARHNELVGQPKRIKSILVGTATDLGRERYFQGAGMIDVLRALQSL